MIDALLYAVRDGIRAANINYDAATCELMDSGQPPPRCGNQFVAIHDGMMSSNADNQLLELYSFSITLTMRVTAPLDRIGDQLLYRNISRLPLGVRQGFYAKAEQLRALLHMNWKFVVLLNQTPNSANDNLAEWASSGQVYGFCEPMRFLNMESAKLVGGEWFSSDPESEDVGVKATLSFGNCKRMQPQTLSNGLFV